MKIVLTGATGQIGEETLKQAIAHNYIEKIFVLTRKPLDQKYFQKWAKGKVVEIMHSDFSQYDESLLRRLRDEGVDGCIWALGTRLYDGTKKDEMDKVNVKYPMVAAEAFSRHLATALSPQQMPKKKFPFRFIFMSGYGAERDNNRSLWLYNDSRKMKGAAEKAVEAAADSSDEVQGHKCFETISLRLGQVIPGGDAIGTLLYEATWPSIAVDRVGKCALKMVLMGTGDDKKRVLENKECLGDDWAMVNSLTI